MGALMAVERVACHLIRMIAGRTQALARRVHARSLKILVGLERLVTTRHAIEWCALLERERVHRYMMRRRRQHAIERAQPACGRLPGKAAHQVARHIETSVLHRRDSRKCAISIVNAANSSQLGIVEGLHAQRDARDTRLGKRGGELGGQRLRIGFASKFNGLAPHEDAPGKFHQALPRQRRRAAAHVDGADPLERPGVAKGIEARVQLLKIGIERSIQVARRKAARVEVAVAALLSTKRYVHIQRGNGHP